MNQPSHSPEIGACLNGIIDCLFIASVFFTIKIPTAIFASLAIACVAIIVNVKLTICEQKSMK